MSRLESVARVGEYQKADDHLTAFREAMRAAGVPYAGEIDGDGQLHRIYVEGDKKGTRNGWYVYHDDVKPAGAFGTKKGGDSRHTWSAKGVKPLTREEREALAEKQRQDKERRTGETRQREETAAARAEAMWAAATDVVEHPYLAAKGVPGYGLKVGDWKHVRADGTEFLSAKGALLVPLRDAKKRIHSLQAIFASPVTMGDNVRTKDFVKGGRKEGLWFTIGKPTEYGGKVTVLICEGYATGASLHSATGLGVVVAFDAGNLAPVARVVRRLMPAARIVIAADNDRWTKINGQHVNVGVNKGRAAASTVDGVLAIPQFPDLETEPSDFNDLHVIAGLEEVRRQTMAAIHPPARGEPPVDAVPPLSDEPPRRDELQADVGDLDASDQNVVPFAGGDPLEGLVERASADPAAAFAPPVLAALAKLNADVPEEFERLIGRLKGAKVGITALRSQIAKVARAARQGARVSAMGSWAEGLIVDGEGRPLGNQANALHALREAPELAGMLRFDEFSLAIAFSRAPPWPRALGSWAGRSWTDADNILLAEWLQRAGISVKDRDAGKAAEAVAREHTFHPVREYLEGLAWDGVSRIERWLPTYVGAPDSRYARGVGARWLISAVARIMKPGVQVDTTLILEGPQGTGKSSVFAVLGGQWFADRVSDLASKDAAQEMAGVWVIEIAELTALRRSGASDAKAFLTRRSDRFRPPYERYLIDVPRQCVFGGTVNPNGSGYLKDSTGARRFWPVTCGKIELDGLKADRDQIWAEALNLYRGDHPWWLEGDELRALAAGEAAQRQEDDPWKDRACEFVGSRGSVSIDEVLDGIGLEVSRRDQRAQNRVAKILVSLGFERQRESTGRRLWRYIRPLAGPVDFNDTIEF